MKDQDIKKIRNALKYKGREDIAEMLKNSRSVLNESNSFGTKSYSRLSSFYIYSPMRENEKLTPLPKADKQEVFNAILQVYPVKDEAPEITEYRFFADFEIDEDEDIVITDSLEVIDFEYVRSQSEKCNKKIAEEDFEGAVTNSRALLESVYRYILEKEKGTYTYKGDLLKLHKDVSRLLNMMPADHLNTNLKQILLGVSSVVNGLSGIRNVLSDSHGSSPNKVYKVDRRHAILAVNLSKTIVEYLYLSYEKKASLGQ